MRKNEIYQNITLILFGSCTVIFLFSVFGKRPQLLEVVVPVLSFIGLVFFALSIKSSGKNNKNKSP